MHGFLLKSAIAIVTISTVAFSANTAFANGNPPSGTDASYIGAGISVGTTSGGENGDTTDLGGNIQGRFAVPNAPVSVRGAILFSDETSAIMPIVSYDIPISNNANVYVGGGYSFVEANGQATPLGNDDSVVLTAGAEAQLGDSFIVYGDTKWGIDAYEDSAADALSFQGGVGYKF
ncbi:MAG: outer membrane beta-barrel protein [Cyanobacteria bacterium P01_E01_bin.42]